MKIIAALLSIAAARQAVSCESLRPTIDGKSYELLAVVFTECSILSCIWIATNFRQGSETESGSRVGINIPHPGSGLG